MAGPDSGRDAEPCVPASMNNERSGQAGDVTEAPTPKVMVRRYASAVLGVCLAHTHNIHDSEDIMQDVFIKAFTKRRNCELRCRSAGIIQYGRETL